MAEEDVEMLKPGAGQRTLFSLAKVVRLPASQVCFTPADIEDLKQQLLDVTQTKHQLLTSLRKLDCFKIQVQDLQLSGISSAVATLAACHPKRQVAHLATSLLQKWRDLVETTLFQPQAYDAEAAREAPDGEAECPDDLIAADKVRDRQERKERRLRRLEEDLTASESEEDEIEPASQEEDPDWAPQVGINGCGKRSKSGQRAAREGTARMATRRGGFEEVALPDEIELKPKAPQMHPFFQNLHKAAANH